MEVSTALYNSLLMKHFKKELFYFLVECLCKIWTVNIFLSKSITNSPLQTLVLCTVHVFSSIFLLTPSTAISLKAIFGEGGNGGVPRYTPTHQYNSWFDWKVFLLEQDSENIGYMRLQAGRQGGGVGWGQRSYARLGREDRGHTLG